MKNILKVTILFCLIIGIFAIPSFAVTQYDNIIPQGSPSASASTFDIAVPAVSYNNQNIRIYFYTIASNSIPSGSIYYFYCNNAFYFAYDSSYSSILAVGIIEQNGRYSLYAGGSPATSNNTSSLYSLKYGYISFPSNYLVDSSVDVYNTIDSGLSDVRDHIDNPPSQYNKNPNVDEFIANTLISMGVKFDTPAYALSYASDAWSWCIDETNMETANPFDEWNIESFVSYCNAQSNNYLNWYNGYKISKDVSNGLGEYIRQNIRLLSGLPAGVTSLTNTYMPIYHYGSGFQSGVSSPTAQTFYPAQTITYFNGEYVNEIDDISTSQFLYTPADVRRFLGYPGSSPIITPSSPTGTGTIIDDPNNPVQKNITINFPALDWLADAIKSILDFLRDAFTTLANLLTQLLDAILGLFSDAFESLSDFGQGIIDWLYAIVAGFSTIGGNYIPASLWAIILPFILINIGVGLIMFVLRSH